MPVIVEKLPDEPIMIVIMQNPIDIKSDIVYMAQTIKTILDSQTEPIWYVGRVEDLSLSFGDLVQALALSTRGEMAFMQHPMIRELIIVPEGRFVRIAASALSQAQYGSLKARLCNDWEEALRMARAEIEAQKQPA
jgi:hypothetical protein